MSAGEPTPDRARIENLETQVRALGEAHAATWERIDRITFQIDTHIRRIDNDVVKVDVRLGQKLRALDKKVQEGLGALEQRLVALEKVLSDEGSSP